MTRIIKVGQANVVFSFDDAFVAVAENFGRDLCIYDLINDKKTQVDIDGLNAFSVVFSEDNKYIAILLFDKISSDLKKILIAECKTGAIIKTVELQNYLKKDFSVITKMQFFNGVVVVSFQYSAASGAVLMSIDLNNDFKVQTKFFKKTAIYHLHCTKEEIIAFVKEKGKALSQKQLIKLISYNNLKELKSTKFEGTLAHNYYLHSFNTGKYPTFVAMTSALYLVPFLRHKKYSCFEIDVSSNCLKTKVLLVKRGKKLPEPAQFVCQKKYMLGEQKVRQYGNKRKIFGVYNLNSLELVGEFVFKNHSISYIKGEKCIDLLSDFDVSFSENDVFTGFYLSVTGKYFHLVTDKRSYIFEAPCEFLSLF